MKKIKDFKTIAYKKFRKCVVMGALATSLAITPLGSYVGLNDVTVSEAEAKKAPSKKVKLTVKRKKANKKKRTYTSGKNYKENYIIKLKNGKKKLGKKKYSIIIKEKDKVLKVTPKEGIENYSKKFGVKKKIIKKGNKASGIKVKYTVDPNVKMKLRENVTIICKCIVDGKAVTKKKKIKNIRYVVGKDYKKTTTQNVGETVTNPVTQGAINQIFEQETGEKVNVVIPATGSSILPNTSIVDENKDDIIYYDDNGNPTTKPETDLPVLPTNPSKEEPIQSTILETETGDFTVISDETSYKKAENNLLNQNYGSGIVLNSIDPLLNTLFFNIDSGLLEGNGYIDYLKLSAKDTNDNNISNNIKIYDYPVKQINKNGMDGTIIIEVTDNKGNLYSQYLNIYTRDVKNTEDILTGIVVEEENETTQKYFEQYLLSIDPIIVGKTDSMITSKENIVSHKTNTLK